MMPNLCRMYFSKDELMETPIMNVLVIDCLETQFK